MLHNLNPNWNEPSNTFGQVSNFLVVCLPNNLGFTESIWNTPLSILPNPSKMSWKNALALTAMIWFHNQYNLQYRFGETWNQSPTEMSRNILARNLVSSIGPRTSATRTLVKLGKGHPFLSQSFSWTISDLTSTPRRAPQGPRLNDQWHRKFQYRCLNPLGKIVWWAPHGPRRVSSLIFSLFATLSIAGQVIF